MKIVRQHRKSAKNAPVGGPQLARIRDFPVFRDLGAHEAELETPKDLSRTSSAAPDVHTRPLPPRAAPSDGRFPATITFFLIFAHIEQCKFRKS